MLDLALGVAATLLFLYAPGYLFFRGMRFSRMLALVAAPLFSCTAYGVLPIAYYKAGIVCSMPSTFGVALLLGAAVYGIRMLAVPARRRGAAIALPRPVGTWSVPGRDTAADWAMLVFYLACGAAACIVLFAGNLPAADAMHIRYDNQTHLALAKSFLDSGMWSSLHPSILLDLPEQSRAMAAASSFYPSLLPALCALCALATGIGAAAGLNAVLFALCAFVAPSGMFILMRCAFPENRLAICCGAVIAACLTGFPWGLFVRALFPNVGAYAIMLPAIGTTMALAAGCRPLRAAARVAMLWAVALAGLALMHPNAVFTAFIFLWAFAATFCGKAAYRTAMQAGIAPKRAHTRRWLAIGTAAFAGAAVWSLCMHLPPLQSVVAYFGNTKMPFGTIAYRTAFFILAPFKAQHILGIAALVGAIACLRRRCLWVVFPAAWMALAYFAVRTQDTALTHILGGFWYTDHVRIGAAYTLFAVPLASLGTASLAHLAAGFGERILHVGMKGRSLAAALMLVLLAAMLAIPAVPGPGGPRLTGIGSVDDVMRGMYAESDTHVYTGAEREFVREAKGIVGDALVINHPADGSVFAYAGDDLNIYYRSAKKANQVDDAKLIRTHLRDFATSRKVRAAVERTGAQYLLLLDYQVPYEDGVWFNQYKESKAWRGLERVDDDTPGFTVVLAREDMRLYRIG